jgi:Gti1/Pac2 family transcription factor
VSKHSAASHSSSAYLHQDRSGGQHPGLVKQAYSAWVTLAPNTPPRKWHLTAYFTYTDLPLIPTVDRDPTLCRIIVPGGIYRSGKMKSSSDDYYVDTRRGSQGSLPPMQLNDHYDPNGYAALRQSGGRSPEDQRVIRMLNSRYK